MSLIVGLAAVTSPCLADVITQTDAAVTLELRFDAQEKSLSLADLLTMELRVEGSPALRVEPPKDAPAGWTLVERTEAVRETIAPERVRWRQLQRFAPSEPGPNIPFALPPIRIRDGGKEENITFPPTVLKVTTQITKPDLSQLQGAAEIEPLPAIVPPDRSWRWWATLAGLGVVAIVSAFLGRRWFSRVAPRSAGQLAMQEWLRLVAMKLPEKGKSERFITLLTTLVRRYLERQFALPARRQTTPEFLQLLGKMPALTSDEQQFLSSFLLRCEAVKFAKIEIEAAECERWAQAARQFLEARENRQAGQPLTMEKIAQSG